MRWLFTAAVVVVVVVVAVHDHTNVKMLHRTHSTNRLNGTAGHHYNHIHQWRITNHHQHARVLCDNNMNYEYACTALSRKVIPITRHYLIKLSFFFRGFIDIAQISRNHCTRRRKNRFRKKKKRIVDEVAFVSFTKNAESNSHQLHFINLKNSFKLIRRFDENEPMKILLKSD